ncbi:MAG: PorT family protein [Sphingobacteriaceae bacterium]|nr:PorT family protein [Sphingobacteriaceae bacterium]
MKKIILSLLLFFNCGVLFSQTKLGFRLGYHISNMEFKTAGNNGTGKGKSSFHAGIMAEVPLYKQYSLQPGIAIFPKGALELPSSGGTYTYEILPVYLEIPLNVVTKFEVGNGKILVGAGPYLAFGIAGSVFPNLIVNGYRQDHPISYGSDENNELKKTDMGANFLTGYEFNPNFRMCIEYGLGLSNVSPRKGESLKNKAISFSLGITL